MQLLPNSSPDLVEAMRLSRSMDRMDGRRNISVEICFDGEQIIELVKSLLLFCHQISWLEFPNGSIEDDLFDFLLNLSRTGGTHSFPTLFLAMFLHANLPNQNQK